jgi:hypothetical protein
MTIAFICTLIYYQFKYRHFKIVKATCRNWIKSTRKGDIITYHIQILTKRTSNELKLDELWVENRLFKVRVLNKEGSSSAKNFEEKEILYLEAERETSNINYEEMAPSTKGKISLGYLINNKRKYLSIKGFEEQTAAFSIAR